MCERARRHLEPTSTLEGKKVLPPGAPNFLPRATLRFPSLAGLANTVCLVMSFTVGFYCAGLKGASPGPEQLARFWDIRVILLAIIGTN